MTKVNNLFFMDFILPGNCDLLKNIYLNSAFTAVLLAFLC